MLGHAATTISVLVLAAGGAWAAGESAVVLDLKSSCELALQMNPHVAGAMASADVAQAGVDKAKSALRPTLDVTSNYTYINASDKGGRREHSLNGVCLFPFHQ